MAKVNLHNNMILVSVVSLLSACQTTSITNTGSGSGNGTDSGSATGSGTGAGSETPATPTSLKQIYDDKLTVSVVGKKSIVAKTGGITSYTNADTTFEFKKNSSGGFDLIVDGETRASTTNDPYELAKTVPDGTIVAFTLSNLVDVKTKGHLAIALDMQYGDAIISRKQIAGDKFEFITGIFGAETIKTTKLTATYNGGAHFNNNYVAAVKLDANFTDGTIGGKISRFREVIQRSENDGELHLKGGEVTINNGKVNNFKISGDLAGTIGVKPVTGNITGGIFGPNAEEAVGSISLTNPTGDGTIVGGFVAKQ